MEETPSSSPPLFSYHIETIGDESSALVFLTDSVSYTPVGIEFDEDTTGLLAPKVNHIFIPYHSILFIKRNKNPNKSD